MKTLISMELSASEAKEESGEVAESQAPKYPWGLSIELNADALKKLGITTLPAVGQQMSVMAMAEVQSASESQYQGDKEKRMNVSLQITDMAVASVMGDMPNKFYGK